MCSYCGCQSIAVIGRFMAEHDEIINATGELRRAVLGDDPEAVDPARAAVAGLLWPHTEAEEAGLFTVMAREDEFTEHISTLCGEHRTLDDYLEEVTFADAAAMALFEDALREHINKEDNGLFPAAAIALSGPDWEEVDSATPAAAALATTGHTHPRAHDHDHAHEHRDPHHLHGDRDGNLALQHDNEEITAAW